MHDTYINVEKKLKIKTNSKGIAKSVILWKVTNISGKTILCCETLNGKTVNKNKK